MERQACGPDVHGMALNMRVKPKKRLKREKSEDLAEPDF
jgi:hypothetical protein